MVFRTRGSRLLSARYALFVLVPAMTALLYNLLLATPGYFSRAEVMIEQDSPFANADFGLGLLPVGSNSSKVDTLVVRNFMRSRTMLEYLDERLRLREHFSAPQLDPWSRLGAKASAEDFLAYYRDRLNLVVDEESLTLSIEFLAYDPAFANQVVQSLVHRGEEFVNEISHYLARQQLHFVKEEVDQANERLKQASLEVIMLQRENEVISPEKETEALGQMLSVLEQELARERIQQKTLSSYLNPRAPDLIASKRRIAALEEQIEQERGRLVGSGTKGLNDLMLSYQDAEANLRLATEVYQTTLATMEKARLEAVRKVKYLVSLDKPSIPDEAEHPRAWYWAATIFVLANLIYFIITLILATIRDHQE